MPFPFESTNIVPFSGAPFVFPFGPFAFGAGSNFWPPPFVALMHYNKLKKPIEHVYCQVQLP